MRHINTARIANSDFLTVNRNVHKLLKIRIIYGLEVAMQVFASEQLQRQSAEVEQSARAEPTCVTFHGKPRLVRMSTDAFDGQTIKPLSETDP